MMEGVLVFLAYKERTKKISVLYFISGILCLVVCSLNVRHLFNGYIVIIDFCWIKSKFYQFNAFQDSVVSCMFLCL